MCGSHLVLQGAWDLKLLRETVVQPKDMREILEERRRARDGKRGTAPAAASTQARPTPAAPQPEAVPEPKPIVSILLRPLTLMPM